VIIWKTDDIRKKNKAKSTSHFNKISFKYGGEVRVFKKGNIKRLPATPMKFLRLLLRRHFDMVRMRERWEFEVSDNCLFQENLEEAIELCILHYILSNMVMDVCSK
jgi:hypothetical protein